MKKQYVYRISWGVLIAILLGCYQETPIKIAVSFDTSFVKKDESVPVFIAIKNTTEGADTYEWTFEGGEPLTSTEKNPGNVTYKKAGTYTITLNAMNIDGEKETISKKITVVEGIAIQYAIAIEKNNYPPVTVRIENKTVGEKLTYKWRFTGATTAQSTERHPDALVYEEEGEYTISLDVSNGFETFTKDTTITVLPAMELDFDWEVARFDDDYQSPVSISLKNHTKNAVSYEWDFEAGAPMQSTEENPKVTFDKVGTHTLTLKASNGKITKSISKTIAVAPNTNLRTFKDVKFGINAAHSANKIGSFFSSELRRTITATEVTPENGPTIDIVFLGFNNTFGYNKFLSPATVENNGFAEIPNARHTQLVNSIEKCDCGMEFTSSQFDQMENDQPLQQLTMKETNNGWLHFTDAIRPRIVLFQTQDGRKGAIKIKQFVDQGSESYVLCDIKIQKLP